MDTLRRVFAALSARFEPGVLWRAGDLDRLLDEDHAGIMEAAAAVYRADSWEVFPEVSFSRYGERGSIDLLSLYPSRRVAVINEVKASINSVEETHRRQDVKVRLCSDIVQERFGWRPAAVGRILVVPESTTIRRTVERHRTVFDASYPARSREVRAWIRDPVGPLAGLWFLSPTREMRHKQVAGGAKRVRVPPTCSR